MIKLQPFEKSDYARLMGEICDARFLLQWAGPKYGYPLDEAQLNETMALTRGEKPLFKVFKAHAKNPAETVGHIQLMTIDYVAKTCALGRVLIYKKHRGQGFGKAMVQAAAAFAFEYLNLKGVTLGVFDFNTPAIATYKKIGFFEYEFVKGARQFQDESWNIIRMKLCRSNWAL